MPSPHSNLFTTALRPLRASLQATFSTTLIAFITIATVGCSTSTGYRTSTEPEDAGKNARAHPAAYGIIDAFTFGKPQAIRPPNDFIFYFKECEMTDPQNDRAFFSKTAYSCTGAR